MNAIRQLNAIRSTGPGSRRAIAGWLVVLGLGPAWTGAAFAQAAPGDDVCVFRRGEFLCDADKSGGEPELRFTLTGKGEKVLLLREIPLLGDLDGDGRDDPCLRLGEVFFCNLARDGAADLVTIALGGASDAPLLGDLDGDGRDDPCVRRRGDFLCDTERDGSFGVRVNFGLPAAVPLLGDLDGDGRDDPCVRRERRWLCDTAHDGGTAELRFAFGLPDDVPLLGDLDGDGRDDPCVYRTGALLCDLAHDGSPADLVIRFGGEAGDIPLLGDLDGL